MDFKTILEELDDYLKKLFKEEGLSTGLGGTTASGNPVSTDLSGGTSTENIATFKKPMGVDSDALVKTKGSHDKIETDANAKKICSKCKKTKGKCKCPKKKTTK
jgi:hypothetical protein